MTTFKLKSLAAPKSLSGSTLTNPDGFALIARCARLKRELRSNRKILGIWGAMYDCGSDKDYVRI